MGVVLAWMFEVGARWAYEEADDPCFDDGQMGGEDGKPGHEGKSGGVLGSCLVQQRCCGDYGIVLVEACEVLGVPSSKRLSPGG